VSFLALLTLASLLIAGAFFLTLFSTAFRCLSKKNVQRQLKNLGWRFFYRAFYKPCFADREQEGLFFSLICTQHVVRFAYAVVVICILTHLGMWMDLTTHAASGQLLLWPLLGIGSLAVLAVAIFFLLGDYLPRVLGTRSPENSLDTGALVTSIFMTATLPLIYVLWKLLSFFGWTAYFDHLQDPGVQAKQELIEIIQKIDLDDYLDHQEKKLIGSVLRFRKHLVREIMVPRVEVFGLAAEVSIRTAAASLYLENYSRVPVYRGNMDNIVGVLMYKDVLQKFMEYEQQGNQEAILTAPVESIIKAPLYIPETKRIANLLQEFRNKQIHMAIVVDEYGGTEGIVTIEDILEQIVGEIADEYDDEEGVFFLQADGSWIVDARMSILDAEKQLGVRIPQESDYDTIGGYLFHCAGTIPSRGFSVHCDAFEMTVLRSNERYIERVRIQPLIHTEHHEEEEQR
jgi:putative hemolysin